VELFRRRKMSIKFQSAVLITDNIENMKEFYINVMGQAVEHDFGGCVIFSCGLSIWRVESNCALAKALGNGFSTGKNNGLEVCFETGDFGVEVQKIKSKGINLIHDVAEEQWGQYTIRFYDPDGNIVELGESMAGFCKRLFRSGLNIAEVSQKTGIPQRKVKEYLK
jgi:catechol 2,3-dioxygenase-like lactoylglutathione lyase family enzyme